MDELQACVDLQIETWGYDESDVIPRKTFLVAQEIGGQVIGAFDTEIAPTHSAASAQSLVGFVFSLPAFKTGSSAPIPYLHSHMLAVRAAYRNQGLGRQLKLEQRREALTRGIRRMQWTFDPLEIKNAFLNIHRLGAIVRTYRVDFYGVSSSRLQAGLPTDRLIAEWILDSRRVEDHVAGRAARTQTIAERIQVPASIYEWKATEEGRERALQVQTENRQQFQQAFSQGLAVTGFSRDAEGNGVYELSPEANLELN
jgi:predicted GNAT superfamily acetyltransferase